MKPSVNDTAEDLGNNSTASGVGEDGEPVAAAFDNREPQMCPYSSQLPVGAFVISFVIDTS